MPESTAGESVVTPVVLTGGLSHRPVVAVAGLLVILWAVLFGLLIACGEVITHSSALMSMDRSITSFVVAHRTSALDQLMKAMTWMGSWLCVLVVAAVVTILTLMRRLPLLAVPMILAAWSGELVAVTVAKSMVERPRPPEAGRLVVAHGWSSPSGHTANALVVFATSALVVTAFVSGRKLHVLTWAIAAVLIATVAFSR